MRFVRRFISRVNRVACLVAGSLTLLIGLIVCYGVVTRYILNRPIGWGEEISTYLMIWAAFLGAGYTMQMDGHIGVDVITRKLPEKVQDRIAYAKDLGGILFLVLLAVKGFGDCALSIRLGETSISELSIPMFIPQLSVPVGSILVALQLVEKLLARLDIADRAGERRA